MTDSRFYEPARLSTPPKPLFSLKPLDANLVEVIVISGSPVNLTQDTLEGGVFPEAKSTESSQYGTYTPSLLSLQQLSLVLYKTSPVIQLYLNKDREPFQGNY